MEKNFMNWFKRINQVYGGYGVLRGITFNNWIKLLRKNNFQISPRYFPRALAITAHSILNSIFYGVEQIIFRSKVEKVEVRPPVFILGTYRSGTTHLQNLMSVDDRFTFPNLFQCRFPHFFLAIEKLVSATLGRFYNRKRLFDNVRRTFFSPSESELISPVDTFHTYLLSEVFPRNALYYDRYFTFKNVPDTEIREWQKSLLWFLKKLTYKNNRLLLIKSPNYTCQIKWLLEIFPDAKFIHIRRNPYAVFKSALRVWELISTTRPLQYFKYEELDKRVIRLYNEMYDVFFEQKKMIPEGHLYELRFEDLEKNPVEEISKIYHALDLPDFAYMEKPLKSYVDSIASYKKNKHKDLPEELKQRIATSWHRNFEEWGYPM